LKTDLTLALGSSGVSLMEMTAAYSAFANRGRYSLPLFIDRIVDRHGNILEENSPQNVAAMSEKTAARMDRMLQAVISRGTGRRAAGLRQGGAGKTGTTDNNIDAWFIGYAGDLLAGVWVGYDRNYTLGKDGSGGRVAAPIWLDFMGRAAAGGN
jgi:penicillin-binding protein 1A